MSPPGIEPELFKQLVNSYSEHLNMSARLVQNARDSSFILGAA
jgi:hypothetical protein